MKAGILTFIAGLALLPGLALAAQPTTYPGFDSLKPSMPLFLNANRHLVVTREAPMCKFIDAPKHPLGRVSVGQKIEALIRQGKKEEALTLIDESVNDGTCIMSKEDDQMNVTGMLMASECNGEYESRANVDQGIGVFETCFYLPVVTVGKVDYATLSVSLRNFEAYAMAYLRNALGRKGIKSPS